MTGEKKNFWQVRIRYESPKLACQTQNGLRSSSDEAPMSHAVWQVLLHTPGPWESSSLKWGNVHLRKDNAARLERVRPRGDFEW
jgi:hypothetical protein